MPSRKKKTSILSGFLDNYKESSEMSERKISIWEDGSENDIVATSKFKNQFNKSYDEIPLGKRSC